MWRSRPEVGADGRDEDEEHILLGGVYAHLCAGADEQRTEVERGAALIGRDEALVELDGAAHHFAEDVCGELGHQNAAASALQTRSVFLHAEHAHLAVGAAEGFQALESLLSVMQTCGSHVDVNGLGRTNFYLAPTAIAVVAAHVIICGKIPKGQICPINLFHNMYCFSVS